MKKLLLIGLAAMLAGCKSDDAKSLSRQYRNLHNEAVDALMMITSESRAKFAKEKIFKPFPDRLDDINKRLETWMQNTEDEEVMVDSLTSDSVPLLLIECPINLRRMDLERQRIEKLLAAKAQDQGIQVAEATKTWPVLAEFARGAPLGSLKISLEKGTKFAENFGAFKQVEIDEKKPVNPMFGGNNNSRWGKSKPKNFEQLMGGFRDRLTRLQPQ